MTTFSEFIKNKAVQDRLPFSIDFELISADKGIVEKVGKYELAKLEELTIVESWFFELVQEQQLTKKREFSLIVNNLTASLISHMKLKVSRKEATNYLVQAPAEWLEDNKYLTWCNKNESELNSFNSLYRQTQNTAVYDMLMITLAMIVRYDSSWTLGRTASLGTKQLGKIKDFLIAEASQNQVVEVAEPDDAEGK